MSRQLELARISEEMAAQALAEKFEELAGGRTRRAKNLAYRAVGASKSRDACCLNCAIARRRARRRGTTFEVEKRLMESRGVSFLKEGTKC